MRKLFVIFCSVVLIYSCKQNMTEAEFLKKVEVEKLSKSKNDSLFLGYYFGMPREEFYKHSWDLNGQHLIREGLSNVSIGHKPEGFSSPVTFYFYPSFYNEKIVHMPLKGSFDNWNILKQDHWSNKLIFEMAKYFEKLWGEKFKLIETKKYGKTLQSVKNNRYIRMRLQDEQTVYVDIFDTQASQDSLKYN